MTYDPSFNQLRLNQLAEQYLKDSNITGRVLFFSESEDNRLDYATWTFDSEDRLTLKKSGFQMMLMELLDALLIYRFQYHQPNTSQGVVHLKGEKISIEWLPKESAEALRNE